MPLASDEMIDPRHWTEEFTIDELIKITAVGDEDDRRAARMALITRRAVRDVFLDLADEQAANGAS